MHLLAALSFPVIMTVVLSACFYIGAEQVTLVVNMIPEFILNGLKVASNILPALGFAMLAKMLISKSTVHYFVFVFALSRRKIVAAHYNHVLTRHLLLEMLKSVERLVQRLVLLGKV